MLQRDAIGGFELEGAEFDTQFSAMVPCTAMTAILLVNNTDDSGILLLVGFGKDGGVVRCAIIDDHDVKQLQLFLIRHKERRDTLVDEFLDLVHRDYDG